MSNKAAWIKEKLAKPLVVDDASYTLPGANEVLVRVSHAAINPVDWKIQSEERYAGYFAKYPNILGCDISGEVVEVGESITTVSQGDRVLCHLNSLHTSSPSNSAFQQYSIAAGPAIIKIPDSWTLEEASVLPLGLSTAAYGLYSKEHLSLPLPTLSPNAVDKVVLVWGGSSSVGINAIQLIKASGLKAATTSSRRNFSLVKSAGADYVFDHTSATTVQDIVKVLSATDVLGAYDAIGDPETCIAAAEVLSKIDSPSNMKLVATVLPPPDAKLLPRDVIAKSFAAYDLISEVGDNKALGKAVWQDFVAAALQAGKYKPLPTPFTVGEGLESVQKGIDTLKEGVSGIKVVVDIGQFS